jgi:hypothetical protein
MISEIFQETIGRTLGIAVVVLPLLLIVEWANHKYGDKLISFFEKRKRFMPFWAAILAILPGCNVAAAVALLYAKGLVSMGALVAAMLATSDEAIYVFLPSGFNFLPLFGAKILLAILAGFAIDIFSMRLAKKLKIGQFKVGYCCSIHEHIHSFKEMLLHVLKHGVKIIFFIFIVLFGFNYVKDIYGFEAIARNVLVRSELQPFFAGLFGLLPGCGTSVILATLYIQGILTFPGALSGLSVASGDTILVLLANKVSKKELAIIIFAILFFGIAAGYLLQAVMK